MVQYGAYLALRVVVALGVLASVLSEAGGFGLAMVLGGTYSCFAQACGVMRAGVKAGSGVGRRNGGRVAETTRLIGGAATLCCGILVWLVVLSLGVPHGAMTEKGCVLWGHATPPSVE